MAKSVELQGIYLNCAEYNRRGESGNLLDFKGKILYNLSVENSESNDQSGEEEK